MFPLMIALLALHCHFLLNYLLPTSKTQQVIICRDEKIAFKVTCELISSVLISCPHGSQDKCCLEKFSCGSRKPKNKTKI